MNTVVDLSSQDISVRDICRNLSASQLYEEAIHHEPGTAISSTGALIAWSGEKTGRSPKDKRVVKHRRFGERRLVGAGQLPSGREVLHGQS